MNSEDFGEILFILPWKVATTWYIENVQLLALPVCVIHRWN